MKLFTFFRSSAAYRVRIALNLKRVVSEQEFVHFRRDGGQHRLPGFLERNPQGLLPVLETEGVYLSQSLAIIEYLDETHPAPRLIPESGIGRAQVQGMAQVIACDVHPLNNLRVLNYLKNELGQEQQAVDVWIRHWVRLGFEALEAQVGKLGSDKHCFGDSVSLVDVCLVPQMYNARRFDTDLSQFPTLVAIDKHLTSLPAFEVALPENQPDAE